MWAAVVNNINWVLIYINKGKAKFHQNDKQNKAIDMYNEVIEIHIFERSLF